MLRSFRFESRVPLLMLGALAAAWLARAQMPDSGSIRGQVVDESGRAVPGASLSLLNPSIGFHREVVSDAAGLFVIPDIPVTGAYHFEAKKEGFEPRLRDITPRAGESVLVNVVLRPAGVQSQVTVYGSAGSVRSDSAQLGNRLDKEQIENTPILGRNITNLPLLDSAVRPARGTGDLFLDNTLTVVDGTGRRQTTYSIDGGNGDDTWGRQTIFTDIPLGAIQEFTVITANADAEFGRTAGGVINVVTKQGTNAYKGELVGLYRPAGLQPNTPVTDLPVGDNLWQGGGVLSGPLVKDRVFLLVGGEYNAQDRGSEITSPLAPGVYTGHMTRGLGMIRADADLSPSDHLAARFNMDLLSDTNPQDVVGGNTLPSAGRTFDRRTYAGSLSESSILSPSVFNEVQAGFQLGSPITEFTPLDPSTQFVRPGVSTEGESRSALLYNHQYSASDTLSWALGNHNIRAGGDFIYADSGGYGQEFGAPFILGQFTFRPGISPTIPTSALTINDVASFQQGFGNVTYNVRDTIWSLFAEDNARILPDLTINVGLRYDRQTLTDDTGDVSPRIHFAWNPGGDHRTVIRGGWGLYYSFITDNTAAAWNLNGPTGFFTFSAQPGQLGFPADLEPLPEFPPGAVLPPRNITVRPGRASYYSQFFDVSALRDYPDKLLNPRTEQVSIGVDHDFGDGFLASLDGVSSRTTRIAVNLDENAPSAFVRTQPGQTRSGSAADATRPITPVANGYRQILVTVNEGRAYYDGLQLNVRKTFTTQGGFLLSYTWSHARNNFEPDAAGSAPNDATQIEAEWADSLLDQRHRVVLSGWWRLPWQLLGGGVFTYATARPYNATTGTDNNGDASNTDRPVINGRVVGRNAFRGTSTYDLTLFLQRDFPLGNGLVASLRAECFNVTNHENVVGRNGTYGNAASGVPLAAFGTALGGIANVEPPRQFQFQARLAF